MPKVPKNDLFRLIESLTTTEKRLIRRFFRQRSNEKKSNSELLFDAYLELRDNDEQALRELVPSALAKNFGYEKHRLTNLLLHSLRLQLSENRIDLGLRNTVAEAKILLERGLYDSGMKKLGHAKTEALDYGIESLVLEILDLERFEVKRKLTQSTETEIGKLDVATSNILKSLRQQARLRELTDRIFILVRQEFGGRTDEDLQRLQKIAAVPELKAYPDKGTFESQKLYLLAHGQLAQYNREYPEALEYYQSLVQLWQQNPKMIATRGKDYKTSLANYLQICHLANRHNDFPAILQTIKSIPPGNPEEEAEDFQNIVFLEFLWKMNGSNPFDALPMIPEIELGISQHGTQINQSRLITLYYNIAVLLFVAGEFRESFFWTQRIIDIGRSNHRKDIRNFARVFEIVLHYELGRIESLAYFFNNAYRILKRRQRLHPFEKAVLNSIRDLDGVESEGATGAVFSKLYEHLSNLKQEPKSSNVLGFEEMMLWIRSKIKKQPMMELLTEIGQSSQN